MTNKRKILYIEDMEECYKKTSEALGKDFEIDWKKNYSEALSAINNNLKQYSAGVFDVNLEYIKDLPMEKQSTEGLELITLAKEKNIHFPIVCASKNPEYREPAIKNGADKFLCKKEFWEKGKEVLEELIKKV